MNGKDSPDQNRQATKTIVLISCVSRKASTECAAKNLYRSDWFAKARIFAEKHGDAWFILSALYGLVDPEETISPYNFTLKNQSKKDRAVWAEKVSVKLTGEFPRNSRLIILAGQFYRDRLLPMIEDYFTVEVPMRGMGIGKQLAFMKRINER